MLGFSEARTCPRAAKGESVADTIQVVSCYADIIAMRHPKEGAPLRGFHATRDVPVINAGDGGHQHPTQTLTDLMTIRRGKGRLDDLTIGLCGDLKFGRTVHSLHQGHGTLQERPLRADHPGGAASCPDYIIKDVLEDNGHPLQGDPQIWRTSMPELDILYMTRVQKERFFNEEDYIRLKDSYVLTREKMSQRQAAPWRSCTPCPV